MLLSPDLFTPAAAFPPGGGAAAPPAAEEPAEQALPPLLSPEELHPALWRADQLGRQRGDTTPSGQIELDAVLPGGGWPARVLTELLLPHAGIGEMRLLAPALAAVQAQQHSVILFDPPALPFAWALRTCGLDLQQLFVVRSREAARGRANGPLLAADVLWALEQALKSGQVGAVLAWLPARLPADALRRLQLAAQGHDGPAFLLRDETARHQPSPAPLRLLLRAAAADQLRVQVLKRRGPPLLQPLTLLLPPVLSAPASAPAPALVRAQRHGRAAARVPARVLPS